MGGERVFRPFVILLSVLAIFSIISVMVMSQMAASQRDVNAGQAQTNFQLEALGGYQYTFIDPIAGYVITTANTSNQMTHPKDSTIVFTDTNHTDYGEKYIQIIRNNKNYDPQSSDMWKRYKDFISVQRQTDEFFKANRWNGASISFDAIAAAFDWKTNSSLVRFDLSGKNDTIVLIFPSNNSALLWANNFTIYYGWYKFRAQTVDYWATISMILTAQVPGLDYRIQFLITFIWMFSYVFIAFTLASRLIPTAGGG
jgi:type II secretory pathway pseudopilin PulG